MKTIIISIICLIPLIVCGIGENDTLFAESKVSHVTVFLNGAQITRTAKISLTKGKHFIVFNKLPEGIDPTTVQVKPCPGITILAVKSGEQIIGSRSSEKAMEADLEKQLKSTHLEITKLKTQLNVLDIEEKVLMDNHQLEAQSGVSQISQIKEAADFYRLRMTEISTQRIAIAMKIMENDEKIKEINKKIETIYFERTKRFSSISVLVESSFIQNKEISFWYYHAAAGWEPLYDFRVEDIGKPLSIVYNANIFQSTGEDWENCFLSLSNSNPLQGGKKPEFDTWFVNRGSDPNINNSSEISLSVDKDMQKYGAIRGRVYDKITNEQISFANIVVEQNGKYYAGGSSDVNGHFSIKPVAEGTFNLKVTCIGYIGTQVNNILVSKGDYSTVDVPVSSAALSISTLNVMDYMKPLDKDQTKAGMSMTSKEISKMSGRDRESYNETNFDYSASIRGSRVDGSIAYIDGVKVRGSSSLPKSEIESYVINDFNANQLKSTVVGIEYSIDIPHTIPSDGSDHTIKIRESQIGVNYIYYLAPKLDLDAFLTAEIADWTSLNLLSGDVSLYFQGTFVGQSTLDMNNPADTLRLSLGRDKSIVCTREFDKEVFDKKNLGASYREILGYTITVKNTRNAMIKIVVEDQYPISELKTHVVELMEFGNAKNNQHKGILSWDLQLNPGERKEIKFKYSIKYPKFN